MAELEAFLRWSFESTAWFRALAFGIVSITFGWRSLRSEFFHNPLAWVAVLTGFFIFTGLITAYYPHLSIYTRATTTPILAILAWHCIQYLRRDPPSMQKLFRRNEEK